MSETHVSPLGIRLFLEGVEVPVISAQVSAQPDRPATAAIQVIPSEMGLHLLPRTLVHLFYLEDPGVLTVPGESVRTTEEASTFHSLNRFDALDVHYKLMFTGEIIGFNFSKNPSSRQLVLQCMDLSSYWDTAYQWYADYAPGGGGLTDKTHQFSGAKKGVFNSISGGTSWVVGRLINTKPKNPAYQKSEGLLAGIIHVLEVVGGLKYKSSSDQGTRGVNDFFTIAELRYNLTGMIGAVEKDVTSAKLYQNKAFRSWLKNGMTSLGNLVSFRDIINHVNRFIFHNLYPQPCPYFTEAETAEKEAEGVTSIYTDELGNAALINTGIRKTLVALTSATTQFSLVAEGRLPSFEGFGVGAPSIPLATGFLDSAVEFAESLKTDDKTDVVENLNSAKSDLEAAQAELDGTGFDPEALNLEGTIANGVEAAQKIHDSLVSAQSTLQTKILGPLARARKIKPRKVQVIEGAHLFNQLILPELFFASPPRCNVIFPDQYYQFSFSRNFMREVSRLMCKGGMGLLGGRRGAKLFGRSYYAPEIRDVNDKLLFLTQDRGSAVLLPHEVHSGIIPKFEWVTDGHRWSVKAARETGSVDTEALKVGYIQRLANFQFYMHRFSARSISVAGMFNPNLALGLPGLVLDKPMPSPTIAKKLKEQFGRRWLPMAYLGKVETLNHQISQAGGTTSVTLSKCRTHRGLDDEFLGTLLRELKLPEKSFSRKFRTKNTLETSNNNAVNLNRESYRAIVTSYINNGQTFKPGDVVRIGGRDSEVVGGAASEQTAFFNTAELRVGFGVAESDATDENFEGDAGLFLPEVFNVDFKQNTVEETIRQNIEEALYPGFYSDVYKNDTIGTDVYQFLLGCRAITDDVVFDASHQDQLLDELFQEDVREAIADSRPGFDFAGETVSETTDGEEVTVAPGSIEEAIDAITMIYGVYKHRGGDLHQFIREYTSRPIATIEDVLGSQGLVYDDNGDAVITSENQHVEGFHSRAFGDFNTDVKFPTSDGGTTEPGKNALHALYPGVAKGTEVKRKSGLDQGPDQTLPIAPELDPRGRAQARVRAYVDELSISRGLPG